MVTQKQVTTLYIIFTTVITIAFGTGLFYLQHKIDQNYNEIHSIKEQVLIAYTEGLNDHTNYDNHHTHYRQNADPIYDIDGMRKTILNNINNFNMEEDVINDENGSYLYTKEGHIYLIDNNGILDFIGSYK